MSRRLSFLGSARASLQLTAVRETSLATDVQKRLERFAATLIKPLLVRSVPLIAAILFSISAAFAAEIREFREGRQGSGKADRGQSVNLDKSLTGSDHMQTVSGKRRWKMEDGALKIAAGSGENSLSRVFVHETS
jgi:hypothetical protein